MSKEKNVAIESAQPEYAEFNPRPIPSGFQTYAEMMEYLDRWGRKVGDEVRIRLAPADVNYKEAPSTSGVFLSAFAIALGVRLPLSSFTRRVLTSYNLAPTQLKPGSWRVVLGFEALCRLHKLSYGLSEFRALYRLQSSADGSCYFTPNMGKLVLDSPESDHGWTAMIVYISGAWESSDPSIRGVVPRAWSPKEVINFGPRGSAEGAKEGRRMLQLPSSERNWRWLLNPWRAGFLIQAQAAAAEGQEDPMGTGDAEGDVDDDSTSLVRRQRKKRAERQLVAETLPTESGQEGGSP